MADALDAELIAIINKLTKIQNEIGGGKQKDSLAAKHGGKIDRFLDLRSQISERLEVIKLAIEDVKKMERVPGANPKELIGAQSKVRTELAYVNDEWRELDTVFRLEAKKRRSKFTPEELLERQDMLIQLQTQIMDIKEMQRAGFVKGYKANKLGTMEENEMFKPKTIDYIKTGGADGVAGGSTNTVQARGVNGHRNNNMTDEHRVQLMSLRERDAQIDLEIDEIGRGVDELRELALSANEEVKLQNVMLDGLQGKMDLVQDKVLNVNERLKNTLEEVRKSDKICVDIVCVIILVGMIIVVYKVSTDNQKKETGS